jgi:hypothetical protein
MHFVTQKALAIAYAFCIMRDMRTHSDIIRAAGPQRIADLTGASIHTVRSWVQRGSIPAEYWALLVSDEHCTAAELMLAAASRRAA